MNDIELFVELFFLFHLSLPLFCKRRVDASLGPNQLFISDGQQRRKIDVDKGYIRFGVREYASNRISSDVFYMIGPQGMACVQKIWDAHAMIWTRRFEEGSDRLHHGKLGEVASTHAPFSCESSKTAHWPILAQYTPCVLRDTRCKCCFSKGNTTTVHLLPLSVGSSC